MSNNALPISLQTMEQSITLGRDQTFNLSPYLILVQVQYLFIAPRNIHVTLHIGLDINNINMIRSTP